MHILAAGGPGFRPTNQCKRNKIIWCVDGVGVVGHIADNPIRKCDDLRTPLCAAQNAQLHQRASDWWHARGGCRTLSRDSTRVTATRLARGESTHNIPTSTLCVLALSSN